MKKMILLNFAVSDKECQLFDSSTFFNSITNLKVLL